MSELYKLTSPSGKTYIGVAKYGATVRFKKHSRDAKGDRATALCNAIRKYGSSNFIVETLLIGSSEYCFMMEKKAILAFNSIYPNGYNMTYGGEGVHQMDESTKLRHELAIKSASHRLQASIRSKIHRNTDKAKESASKSMKDRWKSAEWRESFTKIMQSKWKDENYITKINAKCSLNCTICNEDYLCNIRQKSISKYCSSKCRTKAYRDKNMGNIPK